MTAFLLWLHRNITAGLPDGVAVWMEGGRLMVATPCPRCDREAVGWPLERGDRCSPRDWVYCIRQPELILAAKRTEAER